MVDTERRKKLAFHLRHLAVGLITNDEFEEYISDDVSFGWLPEQYYRSKKAEFDDPIIRPMLELAWCLYGDMDSYKLRQEHQLSDEQLKDIARFILFLHSDLEYEWPYLDPTHPLIRFSFKDVILSVITFGKHYRDKMNERQQEYDAMAELSDYEYWPFISKIQYEEQLKHHPFLSSEAHSH